MSMEYVVMIIVAGITVIGGIYGNHISNKPKKEDNHMNRINLIITQYESWNDDLKERNIKLKKENHVLREKITCLEKRIKELEGGE